MIANSLTATDACGDVNWSWTPTSPNAGVCVNGYAITQVTITATDDCGNTASKTGEFKLKNLQGPSWTGTLSDRTIECDQTPVFDPAPGFANGCGFTSVSSSDVTTPGSCPNEYSITRTHTVTDNCGGVNTISQTINVVDSTPPVAPAQPADVTCLLYTSPSPRD